MLQEGNDFPVTGDEASKFINCSEQVSPLKCCDGYFLSQQEIWVTVLHDSNSCCLSMAFGPDAHT